MVVRGGGVLPQFSPPERTLRLCAVVSDHPYATSSVILIGITLVLSPYLLTALLVLFVATGIPRLPAPVRNFLPGPMREVRAQITRGKPKQGQPSSRGAALRAVD